MWDKTQEKTNKNVTVFTFNHRNYEKSLLNSLFCSVFPEETSFSFIFIFISIFHFCSHKPFCQMSNIRSTLIKFRMIFKKIDGQHSFCRNGSPLMFTVTMLNKFTELEITLNKSCCDLASPTHRTEKEKENETEMAKCVSITKWKAKLKTVSNCESKISNISLKKKVELNTHQNSRAEYSSTTYTQHHTYITTGIRKKSAYEKPL